MTFVALLGRLAGGEDLAMEEMAFAIDTIMRGEVPDAQIALLLTALHSKGESADEIAGAALAMRKHMTRIRTKRTDVIDTCGTGGVGSKLFNISTSAAVVVAAAGVTVAKHGNRNFTSKSGSANVLAELGVNIEASNAVVERCLDELGICFCYAPRLHPSMRHVASVRQMLGTPTIFNLLGPLCNPAATTYQLLGVGRPELRSTLARVLAKLGTRRAAVVTGEDGLGEVTLNGTTQVTLVQQGTVTESTWRPQDFGLEPANLDSLSVDGPAASAAIIREIFDGRRGPARDIVLLNAAAALWTAEYDASLVKCAERAAAAVDHGNAKRLLQELAEMSHSKA